MMRLDRWRTLGDNAVGAPPAAAPVVSAAATVRAMRPSSPSRPPGRSAAQRFAESPSQAEQPHADRRLRTAELAAQLPARPVLPVVREDEPAVLRIEVLHCGEKLRAGLAIARVQRKWPRCAAEVEARVPAMPAGQAQCLATCDGRDPGSGTPRVLAAVTLAPCADERLLRRVFRCSAVPEHAARLCQ